MVRNRGRMKNKEIESEISFLRKSYPVCLSLIASSTEEKDR